MSATILPLHQCFGPHIIFLLEPNYLLRHSSLMTFEGKPLISSSVFPPNRDGFLLNFPRPFLQVLPLKDQPCQSSLYIERSHGFPLSSSLDFHTRCFLCLYLLSFHISITSFTLNFRGLAKQYGHLKPFFLYLYSFSTFLFFFMFLLTII